MATYVRVLGSIGVFGLALASGCSNNSGSTMLNSASGGTGATTSSGNGSTPSSVGAGGMQITITTDQATALQKSCGNKALDANEMCDDGNQVGGDGCTKLCQLEVDWTCPNVGQPCISSAICGDGKLASVETCDDGNTNNDDGCSSDCKTVAPGWQCRVPGRRCIPLCGDGVLTGTENCDDKNTNNDDGCSSTCATEPGFDCTGTPSTCKESKCGNSVKEKGEGCDAGDKNGLFFGDGTGCSKTCTTEPSCRSGGATQACSTACGDGNRDAGEDCDDANQVNGDGCSSDCKVEDGFTCGDKEFKDTQNCSSGAGQCLVVPIIYRDFDGENQSSGHPDFFYMGATPAGGSKVVCVPNASGRIQGSSGSCPGNDSVPLCLGLAKDTLGASGKPEANTARSGGLTCQCQFTDWDHTGILDAINDTTVTHCVSGGSGDVRSIKLPAVTVMQSADTFKEWYTDGTRSTKVVDKLELAQVGATNQYQFASSNGRTVYDDIHDIFLANTNQPVPAGAVRSLSSGFFPLETSTRPKVCNLWPYWTAPATCSGGGWDARANSGTGSATSPITGMMRNFYFTSEVRYLFRYAGGETLQFFGDDDVWVYLNGKLVLDLGAPHERLRGSVTLTATGSNATTEAQDVVTGAAIPVGTPQTKTGLGLEVGKIYEIAIFHADRHPRESNYQLTVSGFSTTRTECKATCGNGVVTAGEECDDGANNKAAADAYGGCTTECKFGPFCGDGQTNGPEECDNGTQNGAPYGTDNGCTNACTKVHFCGDHIIDSAFGEECDDGPDGGPSCQKDCKAVWQSF